jgi:hypothetical protein
MLIGGVVLVAAGGYMLITGKGLSGLFEDIFGAVWDTVGDLAKDVKHWMDTESYQRPTGEPKPLSACPKGWVTDPLTCREPLRWAGWNGDVGGRVTGRTTERCPSGDEEQAGLCYKRCIPGYHGVLNYCWKDTTYRANKGTIPDPLPDPKNKQADAGIHPGKVTTLDK